MFNENLYNLFREQKSHVYNYKYNKNELLLLESIKKNDFKKINDLISKYAKENNLHLLGNPLVCFSESVVLYDDSYDFLKNIESSRSINCIVKIINNFKNVDSYDDDDFFSDEDRNVLWTQNNRVIIFLSRLVVDFPYIYDNIMNHNDIYFQNHKTKDIIISELNKGMLSDCFKAQKTTNKKLKV